ncbi:hypothetical protein HNP86_001872 [Methanococcus maripaludis]|uniref:Uncharacterized protein n=1 Tax=Methanococcus maripaludis TaxID=39152 RepID=A0A7J9NXH4_METMI|nr:hypothetical protein [Methanococcus maripaludis]MBA2851713.1 hypothetical protein [Methanococcus maripaludis]
MVDFVYNKRIIIKPNAYELTDYVIPILFDSSNLNFVTMRPDFSDIQFTFGETVCSHYVANVDTLNKTALVYVKVPYISPVEFTVLNMAYYSDVIIENTSSWADTFGDKFVAIYPFYATGLPIDVGLNGHNAIDYDVVYDETGANFVGTSYIQLPTTQTMFGDTECKYVQFVEFSTLNTADQHILSPYGSGASYHIGLIKVKGVEPGKLAGDVYSELGSSSIVTDYTYTDGESHKAILVNDKANSLATLHTDLESKIVSIANTTDYTNDENYYIGRYNDGSYFNGCVKRVIIAKDLTEIELAQLLAPAPEVIVEVPLRTNVKTFPFTFTLEKQVRGEF